VTDGAAANIRFGNLVHVDGGLHPGRLAHVFQRILEGEGIDDGAEHAHVIGGDPIHALLARGIATDDVAAADHDGELGIVRILHPHDVAGDVVDHVRVDAEGCLTGETFAAQFEQHPFVARQRRRLDHSMNWFD